MKHYLTATLLALALTTSSYALVNTGNPTGNLSAPTGTGGQPSDPGWANAGAVKGSSGIYLGNGWVLTAKHVGAGTFTTTGGSSYAWDGVNSFSIPDTDLTLFKLNSTPDLPSLTIAHSTPTNGTEVVMIGNGLGALSPNSVYSYINPNDLTLSPTPDAQHIIPIAGYLTGTSNRAVRWGTNTISGSGHDSKLGHYFYTRFDLNGGTDYEAQAVSSDSGGAVFYYDYEDAIWYLAGIMVAVGTYTGQPQVTENQIASAFDGNLTYIIDLSQYADLINGVFIPEPATWTTLAAILAMLGVLAVRRRRG